MKSKVFGAMLVLFILVSQAAAEPKFHLRVATTVASPHVWYQGCEYIAKRVAELTSGDVEISIHGSGALGNENATLSGMRLGSIDMMVLSFTPMASVVPEGAIFVIPYIFTGYEHNASVMKTGSPVFQLLKKYVDRKKLGITLLGTGGGGARCYLNTRGPIRVPEDMKGLKIRTVSNAMTKKIWETVGAVPMAVSATEAYSAMQTGVCNAIEASLAFFSSGRFPEIAKYLSLSRHEFIVTQICISNVTMKRLPENYMQAIRQASEEAGELITKLGIENDENLIKTMVDKDKVLVNEIDKDSFIKIFAPLQDEFAKNLPGTEDGMELLNAIRAADNK